MTRPFAPGRGSGGYLVQAAGMAAVAVIAGVPLAAYAATVVASAAVATTRPAQSTLIPSVSVTPDQLTAANVVSWVEAAGIAAAGLLAGPLIAAAGVASVLAVCAGLGLAAALLVARLRVPPLASAPERASSVLASLGASIGLTARR